MRSSYIIQVIFNYFASYKQKKKNLEKITIDLTIKRTATVLSLSVHRPGKISLRNITFLILVIVQTGV